MAHASDKPGFTIAVNLRCDQGVFRLFHVKVTSPDDYYGLRPKKGGSVKFSWHTSGQDHMSSADGTLLEASKTQSTPPAQVMFPDSKWFVNVGGPERLLPYKAQGADHCFEVDWDALDRERYVYSVEIAFGRRFDIAEYRGDSTVVQQEFYTVPVSKSGVLIRVRLVGNPSGSDKHSSPPNSCS